MIKNAILLTAILTLNFSYSNGQNSNIQKLLDQLIADKTVMGVTAGYSIDGQPVIQAVAGWANKKENVKMNLDTKMRMGSIAKPMTALAAMQLVEEGLLDLDAPIQTYLPDYPEHPITQITTRHLLSHTSGIGAYKNGKESNTIENYATLYDALSLFKDRPLLFEPGTQFSYTTYGYTVIGAIIEKVSGSTFESYMQANIFDKANMNHTGVEKYTEVLNNESQLYTRKRGKGKAKLAIENNLSNRIPAGGFYTTMGDMIKFGNAVTSNLFVKEKTLALMTRHHSLEKENNSYGYGWFLYNSKPNVGYIIGHTGGQTGNTSFLFIVPELKVVTIILANTSRAQSVVDPIALSLLKEAMEIAKKE